MDARATRDPTAAGGGGCGGLRELTLRIVDYPSSSSFGMMVPRMHVTEINAYGMLELLAVSGRRGLVGNHLTTGSCTAIACATGDTVWRIVLCVATRVFHSGAIIAQERWRRSGEEWRREGLSTPPLGPTTPTPSIQVPCAPTAGGRYIGGIGTHIRRPFVVAQSFVGRSPVVARRSELRGWRSAGSAVGNGHLNRIVSKYM